MKKLLLVCVIALGVSAVGHAQGRQQRSPEEQAAQMKTQLALNDDQTAKITAIYKAQAASRDSLMKAGGDMRSAMMPMMQATNAKIKAVLTADQAKKYDEMQAARMQRMQGGGGGGGTPPPSRK